MFELGYEDENTKKRQWIMKVEPILLNEEQAQQLKDAAQKDESWRIRQRAAMVLLLARGLTCKQVGKQMQVNVRLVGYARKRWREQGLSGLADAERAGAPPKLSVQDVERLSQWARQEPLSMSQLMVLHEAAGGPVVHMNTLTAALKKARFVWKRTRHSLKKTRPTAV